MASATEEKDDFMDGPLVIWVSILGLWLIVFTIMRQNIWWKIRIMYGK